MTTIALFGTSADPPTAGHEEILKWLSQHYDLVAVWAANNPFKSHQTSLEHRAKMLQILIDSTATAKHNLKLYQELSSHRTIETVTKGKQVWGQTAQLTLVIGSDLVTQMLHWYRIEELLQQVKILVIPRPRHNLVESDLEKLRNIGGRLTIADLQMPAVSSTDYREKGDTNVITSSVQEYIRREQLYLCQTRQMP